MTRVSAAEVAQAAAILESGGLVVFPTETVYGLGADAENPAAVANIYLAKGRPSDHPVIVHVAPGADLDYWCDTIPEQARQLVAAFWPGPLTLILKRAARIPAAVSGGQDTLGLRCPSHPVAIALLNAFKGGKGGVAAPSANRFGHVSPTTAGHVRDEFGGHASSPAPQVRDEFGAGGLIGAILDGGPCAVGIESTIVDLSRLDTLGPVLLRPGQVSAESIAAVIGQWPGLPDSAAPRASGTLASHYAPGTPVAMLDRAAIGATLAQLAALGRRVALIHHSPMPAAAAAAASVCLPAQAHAYAHALYASLRAMDDAACDLILVEALPQDAQWVGVNDRLRRAAHGSAGIIDKLLPA